MVKSRAAQSSDTLVDQVLDGNYRITRFVGRGAMGTIYEAIQLRLNKRVAIKMISRDLAENPLALARFRREAEVTSQLGHPHIVNVFDFGTTPSGESYMAMELLEGEDLEVRLRRVGRLPLSAVTLLIKQVASALAATHARGIVHRDLKPANLFLVRIEGEPEFAKVVDFGISKVQAAATRLTRAQAALGTPQFMSPEQAAARVEEIDHRTDQWALACIAYEALAGRGPFMGQDALSLIFQIMHEEPPTLSEVAPGLPAALDQVFQRALAKKADDRHENITAFARAFEAAAATTALGIGVDLEAGDRTVVEDRPSGAMVLDWRFLAGSRQRQLSLLIVTVAALALSLVAVAWLRMRPAQPPRPLAAPAPSTAPSRPVGGPPGPSQIAPERAPPPAAGRTSPALRPSPPAAAAPPARERPQQAATRTRPAKAAAAPPAPRRAPARPARPRGKGQLIEDL